MSRLFEGLSRGQFRRARGRVSAGAGCLVNLVVSRCPQRQRKCQDNADGRTRPGLAERIEPKKSIRRSTKARSVMVQPH